MMAKTPTLGNQRLTLEEPKIRFLRDFHSSVDSQRLTLEEP